MWHSLGGAAQRRWWKHYSLIVWRHPRGHLESTPKPVLGTSMGPWSPPASRIPRCFGLWKHSEGEFCFLLCWGPTNLAGCHWFGVCAFGVCICTSTSVRSVGSQRVRADWVAYTHSVPGESLSFHFLMSPLFPCGPSQMARFLASSAGWWAVF